MTGDASKSRSVTEKSDKPPSLAQEGANDGAGGRQVVAAGTRDRYRSPSVRLLEIPTKRSRGAALQRTDYQNTAKAKN